MHIEKKTLRRIFIGVICCIVLYWILHETDRFSSAFGVIKGILFPFVLGASLAFIINVPMRAFENMLKKIKHLTLRRTCALLLTFMSVALVLTLVFLLLIPQFSSTIDSLEPKLYNFVLSTEKFIDGFIQDNPWVSEYADLEKLDWTAVAQNIASLFGNGASAIVNGAFTVIGSVTSAIFDIVIAIVFAIYCLYQKETLARQGRKLLYAYLPEKASDYIIRVFRLTNSTFSNFLSGQCVEVCILGCLFAVTMAIFGMPYIPLVCVLIAITAFIPVVGAWVGCILGAFFIFVDNPIQALWFVVMFIILQQVENNLIYPRVVGNSIGLSGMWVLVAVAIGGSLFGVAGMFLMIPFASVLYTLLREATNNRLGNKSIDAHKLVEQPPEIRSRFRRKNKKESDGK